MNRVIIGRNEKKSASQQPELRLVECSSFENLYYVTLFEKFYYTQRGLPAHWTHHYKIVFCATFTQIESRLNAKC